MKTLTDYNPGVPKETNFDHYKERLLEIADLMNGDTDDRIGILEGVPTPCFRIKSCGICDLDNLDGSCDAALIKWGFQEYKEPIYLTKPEHHFLAAMETGYIGRDNHGHLFWFENPPSKIGGVWMSDYGDTVRLSFMTTLKLPFIKYEGTCWSVEQLLELEVKE